MGPGREEERPLLFFLGDFLLSTSESHHRRNGRCADEMRQMKSRSHPTPSRMVGTISCCFGFLFPIKKSRKIMILENINHMLA